MASSSSIKERISLIPQASYQHVVRAAGEEGERSDTIDFTVLSVAVCTLALILCVELFRHKLDTKATGRPFFKTVLEGVYRELATLGIVEFFIFILHKYYAGLNVPMELVFADVHFTLFFTALFNALGSVVVAFFVCRHSEKLWVQPEYQDLHHYVEIREEFDRLEKELNKLKADPQEVAESIHQSAEMRRNRASSRGSIANFLWVHTGGEVRHSYQSLKKIGAALMRSLRYPALTRKYNRLLVQVRFHELKFHFIQANKLPISMHVSDYLKRSELHVLMKMVHISTFAWLLLTAGINLVYFFMGVVVYTTDADEVVVGNSLAGLYLAANIIFVVLALIIWNKMTWIFNNIMHMKLISQTGDAGNHDDGDERVDDDLFASIRTHGEHNREFNQKSLFWGSSPKYITTMIQFMQFGFAVAVSILLVFWDVINTDDGSVGGWYFLVCVLLCYSLFVYIISNVVPRFTLCSSVGQLVDHRRLHETLARHRLNEALRYRQQALMEQEMENSLFKDESENFFTNPQPAIIKAFQSIGSAVIPESKPKASSSVRESITPELLEKLVATDTKDLRNTLPHEEKQKLSDREQNIFERRNRRKTLSEGVEAMRDMVSKGNVSPADRRTNRHNRQKSMSASASIQQMRDYKAALPSPADTVAPAKAKDDSVILAEERAKRRANRKKTMSASADIKMMRMSTLQEESRLGSFSVSMKKKELFSSSMRKMPLQTPETIVEKQPFVSTLQESSAAATNVIDSMSVVKPHPLLESAADAEIPPVGPYSQAPPPVESFESPILASLQESESELSIANNGDTLGVLPTSGVVQPTKFDNGDGNRTEAESDYDDHSDADDLPEIQESDRQRKRAVPPPKRTLADRARQYFRSRRYVIISAVFGTLICFFFVAMRLEVVMICTGVLQDRGNTWQFKPVVGFWVEFAWLAMFVLVDIFIIYIFRPSKIIDNRDRSSLVAAILDLTICVTCFGLLIGAQTQRCCDSETENELRQLAAAVVTTEDDGGINCPATIECCPPFGERLYGGFGDVEMFTSLIALRLLRFLISGFVIRRLDSKYGWSELLRPLQSVNDPSVDVNHPFDPLYERKGADHSHGSGSLEDERGTVVELWKQALGLYPGVVEKHGEFSSELLMAMLGIEVLETSSVVTPASPTKSSEGEPESGSAANLSCEISAKSAGTPRSQSPATSDKRRTSLTIDMIEPQKKRISRRKSICGDSKYSGLTPEAQAFILAGKLGKPIRARGGSQAALEGSTSLGNIFEDSASSSYTPTGKLVSRRQIEMTFGESQSEFGNRRLMMQPEFEVGAEFDDEDSISQFFSPNARLIRSMRRCDRKLMPLLDKWSAVDVVMTKFEIVYFDASDVDDIDAHANPSPHLKRMQGIRQAIIAMKGGKGLRLRDVASGRRVVGHQELKSFDDIHVERILPHESNVIEESGDEPHSDEFWKAGQKVHLEALDESVHSSRNNRWMRVKEDRLKLHTKHDTLYLRFYSDLDSFEHHKERMDDDSENEGDMFKDNALQWCQTIGRLVGSGQLKQDLPHFGDDDNDELRDYLVVVDADDDPNTEKVFGRFKKTVARHRRQRSEFLFPQHAAEVLSPTVTPIKPIIRVGRRTPSFGETIDVVEGRKHSKELKRATSSGAALDTSSAKRGKDLRRADSSDPDEFTSSGKRGVRELLRRARSSGPDLEDSEHEKPKSTDMLP